MNKIAATLCLAGALLLPFEVIASTAGPRPDGKALFLKNCIACHADGGNEINPEKTLFRKDLEKNKVSTPDAIVQLLRKPGPGMLTFDAKTLPDEEARAIAEYILNTFSR